MIVLITFYKKDPHNFKKLLVSHGVCELTGKRVGVPQVHPESVGGVFNKDLREWVLYG